MHGRKNRNQGLGSDATYVFLLIEARVGISPVERRVDNGTAYHYSVASWKQREDEMK
jgi:hypothetical protein